MTHAAIQLLKLVCRLLLRIIRAYGVWCLWLAALALWPLLLVWIICRLWRSWRRRGILSPTATGDGEAQSFAT